jgi:putative transcriptional regulator
MFFCFKQRPLNAAQPNGRREFLTSVQGAPTRIGSMSPGARIDLTNQFLIAMPGMADPHFAGSVVYLCEHTDKGALGLVINKPIDIKLKSLFEKVDLNLTREDLAESPVYFGGPVQTERGFVLHERMADESPYNSTLNISSGSLHMTTSKDVLEALSEGAGPKKVLITLGYSGWGAGQLEDELSRNGWLTVDAAPEVIFDTPVEQRYDRALSLLGVEPHMLSQEAGHA